MKITIDGLLKLDRPDWPDVDISVATTDGGAYIVRTDRIGSPTPEALSDPEE